MTLHAAGIGSRDLSPEQLTVCEKLGGWLVQYGWYIHSGNAPGADQAFARGANQVRPDLVHLHLPWYNFERQAIHPDNCVRTVDELPEHELDWYTSTAEEYHEGWKYLSQGVRKLMTRNSMIIYPEMSQAVDLCLAWPIAKRGGLGGTGHGIRCAEEQGIPLVDLRGYTTASLAQLCEDIKTQAEAAHG